LIKLGLVPFGEIRDIEADYPTLSFNTIGRHSSQMVQTKITSNLSPWFSETSPGEIFSIAVSHGEGRFITNDEMLNELEINGQIATQYVDTKSDATYDYRFNPNGSEMAIEGITDKTGRILGKMGHNERIGTGKNIFKNISGQKDQSLFLSGVKYFR
jgi:phosphoribosylformylglycinamidine synthase